MLTDYSEKKAKLSAENIMQQNIMKGTYHTLQWFFLFMNLTKCHAGKNSLTSQYEGHYWNKCIFFKLGQIMLYCKLYLQTGGIKKLEYYWSKCIELTGDYVKNQIFVTIMCFLCQAKNFLNYSHGEHDWLLCNSF